MGHVMADSTADCGTQNGVVMSKVTTDAAHSCAFQAASGLCAETHCSQRDDQRDNKQFHIHPNSLKQSLGRLSVGA